jgi:hypothetical protein
MYLTIKTVRYHKLSFSVLLFLILFSIFHALKPGFAYTRDGAIRQFGIGYRDKTVIPIWFIAIILAIMSYLVILGFVQ